MYLDKIKLVNDKVERFLNDIFIKEIKLTKLYINIILVKILMVVGESIPTI